MYKLTNDGVIHQDGFFVPNDIKNRHWQDYLSWIGEGNTPDPADDPTPEQIEREQEIQQAPLTAREYFAAHSGAIDFIRLTPEEQEAQIDAMTTAQLKTVVKYLTIAASAIIKTQYL